MITDILGTSLATPTSVITIITIIVSLSLLLIFSIYIYIYIYVYIYILLMVYPSRNILIFMNANQPSWTVNLVRHFINHYLLLFVY